LKSLIGGNDWGVVANLRARRVLYVTAFAAAIAAVALACRRRPLDQAALLALPLIPVLNNPANYYSHFIFLLPLLGASMVRARAARKAEAASEISAVEAAGKSEPAEQAPALVVAEVRRDVTMEGEALRVETSARVAVATASDAADDSGEVAVEERKPEKRSV